MPERDPRRMAATVFAAHKEQKKPSGYFHVRWGFPCFLFSKSSGFARDFEHALPAKSRFSLFAE
jgi:hypothetical protein